MRKISEAEESYSRMKGFVDAVPSSVYASMRNHILNPKALDSLIKAIKENGGYVSLEFKDEWQLCFRDERDLSHLLKLII
jgi:hypothetical protein